MPRLTQDAAAAEDPPAREDAEAGPHERSVDQQRDDRADDRADDAGRLQRTVFEVGAEHHVAEESADERPDDAEDHRRQEAHSVPSRHDDARDDTRDESD